MSMEPQSMLDQSLVRDPAKVRAAATRLVGYGLDRLPEGEHRAWAADVASALGLRTEGAA